MWDEWGGYAQWPGERRHTGPHHWHDLVLPRPDQLYCIGVCAEGAAPHCHPQVDTNLPTTTSRLRQGVLKMTSTCPSDHAGIHTTTHSHTQYSQDPCQTAFHPHHQTLPLSPISYLGSSTRPGIQAVFTDLQTTARWWPHYGSSTKTFRSENARTRLTPQEQEFQRNRP